MLCRSKRQWYLLPLIAVMLSGCVSTPELVVDLYQSCKYRNDCIGDRVQDWWKEHRVDMDAP